MTDLQVALTLDAEHPDRPATAGVAEAILELFERLDVTATFFVQGRWAEAYPGTARAIVAAGHLAGSHSHYHARLPLLSDDGLAEDIRVAETVIRDIVGADPRPWFRCPFGAGSNDPRVIAALDAAGYRNVGWDVGVDDWDSKTGAEVERDLVSGILARGSGAVVLLHTWPDATLAGLRAAIPRLRDAGAAFVRIDELAIVPTLPKWMQPAGSEASSTA